MLIGTTSKFFSCPPPPSVCFEYLYLFMYFFLSHNRGLVTVIPCSDVPALQVKLAALLFLLLLRSSVSLPYIQYDNDELIGLRSPERRLGRRRARRSVRGCRKSFCCIYWRYVGSSNWRVLSTIVS